MVRSGTTLRRILIAVCGLGLAGAPAAFAADRVNAMMTFRQGTAQPWQVRPGVTIPVFGNATDAGFRPGDGSANGETYTFSFAANPSVDVVTDGSLTGTVANDRYIVENVTFNLLGGSTREVISFTLTVDDGAGSVASETREIDIVDPSDPISNTPLGNLSIEVNIAIQDGLRALYLRQQANGRWTHGRGFSTWDCATTGFTIWAFANSGHLPINDVDDDIYAEFVQQGVDFILGLASAQAPVSQPNIGNPDGDGNGRMISLCGSNGQNSVGYATPIAAAGVIAAYSSAPGTPVPSGALAGESYSQVIQDTIDWIAFGQQDGGSTRGGWRYNPNGGADTSADSWSYVALEGFEGVFGGSVLELVKQEAERRINASQSQGGAGNRGQFGYTGTGPLGFDGNATTAGGLSGLVMVTAGGRVPPLLDGALSTSVFPDAGSRKAAAVAHLGLRWDAPGGTWAGNRNNFYAMWTTARALRLNGTSQLVDRNGVTFDWETGEAPADPGVLPPANSVHEGYFPFLVRTQAADGTWAQTVNTGNWTRSLNTAWGVLVLQPTVFGPPPTQNDPPVCDAGGPYELAPESAAAIIPVDGSASSDPDGDTLSYFWSTDHPNAVFDNKLAVAPLLVAGRSGTCVEEFNVRLVVSDGQAVAVCEAPVTLRDETPPAVSVSCQNELLWPPDHDLQGIGMSVGVEDCDPGAGRPENVSIEVWSDEPELETGVGDGEHAPDARDFGQCLAVRAEREGTSDGRVYLVAVASEDGAGNVGYGYCTVLVPQSQSPSDLAAVRQQADDLLADLARNPGTSPASLGLVRVGESAEVGPRQEIGGNPTCNRGAPLIVSTSSPPVGAAPGELYTYQVDVIDPEDEPLTYTLTSAPAGMTIDADGLIEWLPGEEQIGIHEVVVEVTDPGGSVVRLAYLVVVTEQLNLPPIITSEPPTQGREGDLYEYDVEALDLEEHRLTFLLASAPEGMSIDFASGLVSWTPSATQSGRRPVVVEVCDELDACTRQAFEITVAEALNTDPEIVTTPVTLAVEGENYRYDADAVDADSDALTYGLGLAPAGMGVNSVTGEVFWTPSAAQAGLHDVRLEVRDGRGGLDVQLYTIEVVDALNGAPVFVTSAPTSGAEGALFVYDAEAVDPEGAAVTYSLLSAPPGMTLQPATGLVEWTPAADQAGSWAVELLAADPLGAASTQSFTIDVAEALNAPPAFVTSPLTSAVETQPYVYAAAAVDSEGDPNLTFSLDTAPNGMTVGASTGVVTFTPAGRHVGDHTVVLRVADSAGASAVQSYVLTVISADDAVAVPDVVSLPQADAQLAIGDADLTVGDVSAVFDDAVPAGLVIGQTPSAGTLVATGTAVSLRVSKGPERSDPLAQLVSPAPESEISSPVDVIGNVLDAGDPSVPLEWEVRIAPFGTTDFRTIGSGTGEVIGGVIGRLDPSLLANGPYRLEILLRKGPFFGGPAFRYHLVGGLKVGTFSLEFVDLSVPLVGVPISISRRYDTLDLSQGDFGAGWRLSLAGDVRDGVPQGQAFTAATRVYVTRPDGERVGFTFAPFLPSPFFPIWLPAFAPDPGVFDRLSVDDAALFNSGGLFFDFATPYNPRRYYFETKEGVTYTLDELDGLLAAEDRDGNSIVVTAEGITHSSGVAIRFERDAEGRITRIFEPQDPDSGSPPGALVYGYDARGNLVSFTDQGGFTTEYLYEIPALPNYLTGVEDPLDRPLVRTVYDDDGRIIAQCDGEDDPVTLDGCILIDSDVDGGVQTVVDGRGFRTDFFFDALGRVTLERLFLGDGTFADTRREYVGETNLVARETDPNGNATVSTYDARGNLLTRADALGNVERFEYDGNDRLTRRVDKLGRVGTFTYDGTGRLLQEVDPSGVTRSYAYDSLGRLASLADGNGQVVTYTYESSAQIGPSVELYPDGTSRQFEYDSLGRMTREIDRSGVVRTYGYDALGRLTTSASEGLTVSVTYEGNSGRIESWTDSQGNTYLYDYDSFGHPTSVTYPGGGVVEMSYDADGNLAELTDPGGNTTSFDYDAAGRLIRVTDATGASVNYGYDAAGNGVEVVDRNGRRRTWEYDAANRAVRELWHEGSAVVRTFEYEYDAEGNLLAAADGQSSLAFTYDPLDRVASVDNAGTLGVPPLALQFAYDGNGDVVSITDDGGVGVALTYNVGADLTSVGWQGGIGDGAGVLLGYDARSALASVERFADVSAPSPVSTTALSHDPLGRIESIEHAGPGATPVAEYAYEFDEAHNLIRESHHGDTFDYTLDALGQLLEVDRLSGPDESYSYDASGNRLSSHLHGAQYQIGADNRLLSNGRTDFQYDGEGNLVRAVDTVTGVVDTYAYDHRNRLVGVESRGASGELLVQALFAYDVFDRRIVTEIDADGEGPVAPATTASVYSGPHVWADFDENGLLTARYLYGGGLDQILARARPADGVAFHLADHIGTVRDLVDAAGALIDSIDYDAFGNVLAETDPSRGDRYKLTGREWQPALGLHFFRSRYYDPENGRFLSKDLLDFNSGDANLYRYVFNSPADLNDPTGLTVFAEYSVRLRAIVARISIIRCLGFAAFTNLAEAGVYLILTDPILAGAGKGLSNVYAGSTNNFAVRFSAHSASGVGGRGARIISQIPIRLSQAIVNDPQKLRTAEQLLINAFGGKAKLLNVRNASRILFCK